MATVTTTTPATAGEPVFQEVTPDGYLVAPQADAPAPRDQIPQVQMQTQIKSSAEMEADALSVTNKAVLVHKDYKAKKDANRSTRKDLNAKMDENPKFGDNIAHPSKWKKILHPSKWKVFHSSTWNSVRGIKKSSSSVAVKSRNKRINKLNEKNKTIETKLTETTQKREALEKKYSEEAQKDPQGLGKKLEGLIAQRQELEAKARVESAKSHEGQKAGKLQNSSYDKQIQSLKDQEARVSKQRADAEAEMDYQYLTQHQSLIDQEASLNAKKTKNQTRIDTLTTKNKTSQGNIDQYVTDKTSQDNAREEIAQQQKDLAKSESDLKAMLPKLSAAQKVEKLSKHLKALQAHRDLIDDDIAHQPFDQEGLKVLQDARAKVQKQIDSATLQITTFKPAFDEQNLATESAANPGVVNESVTLVTKVAPPAIQESHATFIEVPALEEKTATAAGTQ